MNSLTLRIKNNSGATCISNKFIDDYMADANGEFVKVYLYLLRCVSQNRQLSVSVIADKFNNTETDVIRALKYWEKMKLLKLTYTDKILTGISILDFDSLGDIYDDNTNMVSNPEAINTDIAEVNYINDKEPDNIPVSSVKSATPSYTADQLKSFQENEEIKQILFVCEAYLGKTLSPSEINTLLFFYDKEQGLGFSVDLIEYLIEYCVSKGHKSINQYAKKTAIAWKEQEIKTVTQAKAETIHYNADFYKVFNSLGIKGRKMVPFEANYIDKWINTYAFTTDVVIYACERTIALIHQPDFKYVDSILTNWYNSGVKHLGDAKALDAKFQAKKAASKAQASVSQTPQRYSNLEQRSYDYNELEKELLTAR